LSTGSAEAAVFALTPETDVLARAPVYRDMPRPADRLRALGRALAASPSFREMSQAVLVVRTEEPQRLALLGRLSSAEMVRAEALPSILDRGLRRLRYVSYGDAEAAARSLAGQLVDGLGAETLARCSFVGLPRGGLIVMGMLAYLLDLRAEQISGSDRSIGGMSDKAAPLVVVDDCALSGFRFAEVLEQTVASSVVFAHLFSHPDLRKSIREREQRVSGCYAGEDLLDLADEILDEDRMAWEERWHRRSDGRAYWFGLPEHVCFPWNEPDITIWNAETGREEAPWRMVPPDFCLKNRPVSSHSLRLQEQPVCEGPIRPTAGTVFARLDDGVVAADVENGQAFSFQGIAGKIWMALVAGAGPESVVDQLVTVYDVEHTRLRSDVDSLVRRAVDLGLLERVGDA